MKAFSDITSSSRRGSIGGFVTWANSCLKYAKSVTGRFDRTASAASSPMDPMGSCPREAIGAMMSLISSSVYPNACCLRRSSSGSSADQRDGTNRPRSSILLSLTHFRYGFRRETAALISLSGTIRFWARSSSSIFPGWSRPRWTIRSAGTSITPVSEARTIIPSRVTVYRAGRRPFRSSVAPRYRPSQKTIAAGPSQGSMTAEWYS